MKISKEGKVLAKNTFFLYILKISGYVFPLFTFPYLTRVLGPQVYGRYVFSVGIMSYFQMVFGFGFILSATSECSLARNDKQKLATITFGVVYAKLFLVLLGFLVIVALIFFVERFNADYKFYLFSFFSIASTVFLPDYLFRGIEQMEVITYRVILSKFVYTLLVFLLIKVPSHYIRIPIATIISNVFAIVLTWYFIFTKLKIKPIKVTLKKVFLILKESLSFFISRAAVTFYTTLNTILLGSFVSEVTLGLYGVSNNLLSVTKGFISPIADAVYPYMVKSKNLKMAKKLIVIFQPLIVLGAVIMFVFSKFIINLVAGAEYIQAIPYFRLLIPQLLFILITYLFGYPLFGAIGKPKIANYTVVLGSLFHIIGLVVLFLTKSFTVTNVIILTFFTELVICILRCMLFFKYKEKA